MYPCIEVHDIVGTTITTWCIEVHDMATQESGRSRLTQHSSSQQISCGLDRNLRGTMSIASGLGEIGQAVVAVILRDQHQAGYLTAGSLILGIRIGELCR